MMNTAEAAGAAGTIDMKYVLTCVLLMALVTYIPRVLPVTSSVSTDISGCIFLHGTSLFGGRRNDRSGDFGI